MQLIEDRRALHRIPELDRQLPQTMAYLRASLEKLNCKVFSPMESALCAFFDFGQKDAIAFRADADALPIQERNKVDYHSQHEGCMHACGHDGHMAILLELARRLSEKKSLPHNVLLVFQPAEETTGGAKDICATGVFRAHKVQAIFGLHLWPQLPEGVIASRKNEMMARSCEVRVDVYGKSAHIAKAQEGVDALAAGDPARLGVTVQVCDSGISPGSGVANRRKELSPRTLGVPVVAVGVPTVVDYPRETSPEPMMVTPREVDTVIENAAKTVAFALNKALQPELALEDILALVQ